MFFLLERQNLFFFWYWTCTYTSRLWAKMLTSLEPLKPNNKWLNSTLFLKNRRKDHCAFIIFAWWIDVIRYQQWHHRCRSEIHCRHHYYLYQRLSMQCIPVWNHLASEHVLLRRWLLDGPRIQLLANMEIKIMATFFFIKYRAGIFSWEFDWNIIK